MLTDIQAAGARSTYQPSRHEPASPQETRAFPLERRWRQPAATPDDITISRWTCTQTGIRHEEATTPADRYFFAIALKTSRAKLTRGRHTIFDGIMPAGTLYIGAPLQQLSAQFSAPCDFLHFHVSASTYFPFLRPGAGTASAEGLNDLVLLRDPFAEQLAKALTERGHSADREFARCIGQTLAMHLARRELPHSKVNALPKWRLRRVEEYVGTHFDHCIQLVRACQGGGTVPDALRGPVSRRDGIPAARVPAASAHRACEIAAVEFRDGPGRGGADRRLLHPSAFLDRLQTGHG